ncbi:MAG: FHA domain-containing protein [Polyangiaceae bacterium]
MTIEDPDGQRVDVTLTADEYLFGRGPHNKVRLTDRNVSRRHARLVRLGLTLVLEDLGSFNGKYLNAEHVIGHVCRRQPGSASF